MPKQNSRSQFEFVALMAALMSVTALSIDALLPALDIIGEAVQSENPADNQLLITMIFLGLGIGPMVFGPLSDSIGRKPSVYMGFGIFTIASFICIYAQSLELMVAGRILQGVGLSAPRTVSIAIIRDMYDGDHMARIMSFVTVVFLLIPIVAPAMGQFILIHYNWQGIFYVQIVISILVALWFWMRQQETLSEANRIPFSVNRIIRGLTETLSQAKTLGYTIISGFVVGSFLVYLSTSQQIFQNQYGLKEEFPYIFAGLAIAMGIAIFLNGTFVVRFGMEKMVTTSLLGFFGVSVLYIILFHNAPHPNIYILLLFFALQFFCIGFLFGNLRALAMEPVGHIAGIAAAITGLISTLMAVPISTFIGRFVMESTLPLFIGFSVCGALSLAILFFLKRKFHTITPEVQYKD
ncbi:multidrug effflux MFS transporter [Ulvibacter antarcticus]|uniref:DHA1 family bicyclomycin/chloramphenicol resistance-like MFS transporter n=1 Tax=Ulvibacter antarcticus TaxID=442714 RepID=A0A3L9YWU6_9FLAO|nr:multidrug effflux MFS transporter [Ulvibacter antarcticus]RMA64297.1 DHA1 family bicyclomycin/chloramphenicol resistance-like MFS transporter [Ulvibacter antarcticus]